MAKTKFAADGDSSFFALLPNTAADSNPNGKTAQTLPTCVETITNDASWRQRLKVQVIDHDVVQDDEYPCGEFEQRPGFHLAKLAINRCEDGMAAAGIAIAQEERH